MKYDSNTFTWGLELEFGDVRRSLTPPHSSWSSHETDIVNIIPPYYGKAADPIGLDPPVGGELNVYPTNTIEKQIEYVQNIIEYFRQNNSIPTSSCVSQTHVHVHVPNLLSNFNDIKLLLFKAHEYQDVILKHTNDFKETNDMSLSDIDFLRNDNGRKYEKENVIQLMKTNSLSEFMKVLKHLSYRSETLHKRYYINLLTLGRIETIEFRCFRGTTDLNEIRSILLFCRNFLEMVFNEKELSFEYSFPKLHYDHELFTCWKSTKHKINDNPKPKIKMLAL